jgi:hypothetical protein
MIGARSPLEPSTVPPKRSTSRENCSGHHHRRSLATDPAACAFAGEKLETVRVEAFGCADELVCLRISSMIPVLIGEVTTALEKPRR